MLSATILALIIGAIICFLLPRSYTKMSWLIALLVSIISIAILLSYLWQYERSDDKFQFIESIKWIPIIDEGCLIGISEWNKLILLLIPIVIFVAIVISREVTIYPNEYFSLILIISAAILGGFMSQNLLLAFAFHELALIPTLLSIFIWGRASVDDNKKVAFMSMLYPGLGSLLILVGLIGIYVANHYNSFNITILAERMVLEDNRLFLILLIGFLMTIGIWPFHVWVPRVYTCAPFSIIILHSGGLKLWAIYWLYRISYIFSQHTLNVYEGWIWVASLLSIWYCGIIALRTDSLEKTVSYATIIHSGFALLAIIVTRKDPYVLLFLLMAYGLTNIGVFAINSWLWKEFQSTKYDIIGGGMFKTAPFISFIILLYLLAMIGFPIFGTFLGELMLLTRLWEYSKAVTIYAIVGLLLIGTAYSMLAVKKLLFGKSKVDMLSLKGTELLLKIVYLIPLVFLTIMLLKPHIFIVQPQIYKEANYITSILTNNLSTVDQK